MAGSALAGDGGAMPADGEAALERARSGERQVVSS